MNPAYVTSSCNSAVQNFVRLCSLWDNIEIRMGKRRRNRDATRQERKHAGKPGINPETTVQRNLTADIDADCLQYHSGSDNENPQISPHQREHDGGVTSSEEHDDSEPELAIGDTIDDESEVELSIEFFDPTPADVLPLQNFLRKYEQNIPTRKAKLDLRKVAETICSQTRVGTTIRVTDDETPIGFISCLNMRDHSQLLAPIRKHLLRLCEERKEFYKFSNVLKSCSEGVGKFERERTGLILCERVLNFPPVLVPKLLDSLFCEIEWAVEDEPTQKERDSFKFGWYLYITEVYTVRETEDRNSIPEGEEVKKKRKKEENASLGISFARVEDEAFHKHASTTLTWKSPTESSDPTGIKRSQMAMLINGRKIEAIRRMVSDLVGSNDNHDDDKQDTVEAVEPDR